jgi:alpha-mannosidase
VPVPNAHLVVVPHTHWDREWYRTHEAFRVRLVALVDLVLDVLENDPDFSHFTLDGQTIVVDDYLAVRPHARARIEKLVREGRLLVGPWHVLPDEWLVSGEALIRNLRFGLERAAALGGAMRLGYVPDQFGHVGQLPQVFQRFGFDGAALWRGVGDDVKETAFWWEAPDGTRLLTLYLATGYGNAALLPLEPDALAARLDRTVAQLSPFVPATTYCFMNGSDHLSPAPGLPAALAAAVPRMKSPASYEIGTLPRVHARLLQEQGERAPVHRGELRSGLRAPLLPGCASARLWQKQREFANDHLLTRVLEPLAAWASLLGARVDRELLAFTWSVALENHPHDSICGCSVDGVHAQMETRFDRVRELAGAQLERLQEAVAARLERAPAGAREGDAFVVWNGNAGGHAQVEAELELDLPGLDPSRMKTGDRLAAHVRAADGREIPAHLTVALPGAIWSTPFSIKLGRALLADLSREFMGFHSNAASWTRDGARLDVRAVMGSEPRGDFDLAAAKRAIGAHLADPTLTDLHVEARRPARLRVSFVDTLPGHGLRVYRVASGRARGEKRLASGKLPAGGAFIENETWRLEAAADGRIQLTRRADGLVIADALRVVSEGDRGDTYNFDPVAGDVPVERPVRAKVRVESASATEATLLIALRYEVPRGLAPDRATRDGKTVELSLELRLRLLAGLDRVEVAVKGHNTAEDQRLRLHLRAPFRATRFEVESAFETAERPIAPRPDAFGSAQPAEYPVGAVPQRRFATIRDGTRALTVAGRGNSEVEAVPEKDGTTSLAVTLLRAIGWLSGNGLSLRPGPAGPLFPTPGAQVPGPFHAELSLRLHPTQDPLRVAEAHRFAHPPAAFEPGDGAGKGLRDGARLLELDDPEIVVSACEPGPDGTLRVRLYEASGKARRLRLRIPGAAEIRAIDLLGRPDPALALTVAGDSIEAALRGWQIVDLEARFPQR